MELSISNHTGVAIEEDLKNVFFGFMIKSKACKERIEKLSSPIKVKIVVGKIGDEAYCEDTTVVLTTNGKTDKSSIDVAIMAEDLFFEIGNVMNDVSNKSIRLQFFKGDMSLKGVGIAKAKYEAEQMWPYFQGLKDLKNKNVVLSQHGLDHLERHEGENKQQYIASFLNTKQSIKPNAPAVKKLLSPDFYSYTIIEETSILKIRSILKAKVIGAGAGNFGGILMNLKMSDISNTDLTVRQPVYWVITKMISLLNTVTISPEYNFSIDMETLVKTVTIKDENTKEFIRLAKIQSPQLQVPVGWSN